MNKNKNTKGKQLRKPVSSGFSPKRLALNFDPPMIIMEYLVVDTGKLYHHKMRLDSILRRNKVNRDDVLNYIKTKHHLYFVNSKIKDVMLLKFIDKILARKGIVNQPNTIVNSDVHSEAESEKASKQNADDFDYLNDDEEEEYYDEDYQDYQDPSNDKQNPQAKENQNGKSKNTFLTYQQQDEDEEEQEGQANWDLDLDENDDFV